MQCYIHDDSNNKIQKSNALYNGSLAADFWWDSDSYGIGLHENHYQGSNIDIGIHAKFKAAAIDPTTTVDVFSGNNDSWDGFVDLDQYTVEIVDK